MLATTYELWERGVRKEEERIIKGPKESLGCAGYLHYLDVWSHQYIHMLNHKTFYTLHTCHLFHVIIPQKRC